MPRSGSSEDWQARKPVVSRQRCVNNVLPVERRYTAQTVTSSMPGSTHNAHLAVRHRRSIRIAGYEGVKDDFLRASNDEDECGLMPLLGDLSAQISDVDLDVQS